MTCCPKIIVWLSLVIFLVGLGWEWKPKVVWAQSGALFELADVIDVGVPTAEAVHSLSFRLPSASQQIVTTDYIQINLPYFTNVTAPTRVVGTFTGTPVYSVSGKTAKVTGINVLPNRKITIEGFEANNPGDLDFYDVVVSVTQDEAGNIVKNTGTTVAVENPGTVQFSATLDTPQSRLEIQGYTSPLGYVIFTEAGSTRGTITANPSGYFLKIFPSFPPGDHNVNFYSIDTSNRTTSIRTVTVNTPVYQTIEVSDQLLSPTIEVSGTSLTQANALHATGSAYPGTTITLFTDTPVRTYTASASASGDWTYSIATLSAYTPGDYRIYSLAQTPGGLQSLTSPVILFTISSSTPGSGSACGDIEEGDLNCDGIVNLTDFSILMYYWGTNDATADMNNDGLVDLIDFSVMMYYWGT